ncbi:MAG: toxin-antitoxin system YwqK family antitoxin, partial [Bacteroidota bacterium]
MEKSTGRVFFHGSPFTGNTISYHTNGMVASESNYENGRKDGAYQKWFDNGVKSFEANYSDGKREGPTISWWKNGNVRSESFFVDGIA